MQPIDEAIQGRQFSNNDFDWSFSRVESMEFSLDSCTYVQLSSENSMLSALIFSAETANLIHFLVAKFNWPNGSATA